MPRDVHPQAQAANNQQAPGSYIDRLYKLIPAEFTAAYLAISTLLLKDPGPNNDFVGTPVLHQWMLGIFVGLLVLLPIYLWRVQGVRTPLQLIVTTISFPIWASNINAPLVSIYTGVPQEALAGLLIAWTILTPAFVK